MTEPDATTLGPLTQRRGAPPRPALRVLFSGTAARHEVHALRAGATPIGRGVDSVLGIRLDADPRLSRQHARVVVDEEGARLINDSQHGTLKNGAPVEEAPLDDGDLIQVGDTFLIYRWLPADLVDAKVPSLLGVSPAAVRLRSTARLVGPTASSVLLLGPTGTGKEVMARALHDESGRRGRFVVANPTGMPDALVERELFGEAPVPAPGARGTRPGWLREAEGGTLFLDEVGALPLSLQPRLVRVLDERRALPVGSSAPLPVDVRVIAASNADLDLLVREGRLRADLYARLAEITVHLPPLLARREDVLPLLLSSLPAGHAPLEPALVAALLLYPWPYHVREVQKVGTELGVLGVGRPLLTLDLVAERLRPPRSPTPVVVAVTGSKREPGPIPDKDELVHLLKKHHHVIADVARATGRSRKQVYRWLDKHGLRHLAADKDRDLDDDSA
ncbi:MAG: sigma 54-interacting transcriptional regulator [Deltaproteobacteria bacterium]|nr:sigma 54-interacting transcriptional regulator [Deltaproteobacteria bacterium]